MSRRSPWFINYRDNNRRCITDASFPRSTSSLDYDRAIGQSLDDGSRLALERLEPPGRLGHEQSHAGIEQEVRQDGTSEGASLSHADAINRELIAQLGFLHGLATKRPSNPFLSLAACKPKLHPTPNCKRNQDRIKGIA